MIAVGGFKVFPSQVEDVLYQHPAVKEALVIGVADVTLYLTYS
jgi:long-chain acyl-CoA synthetase